MKLKASFLCLALMLVSLLISAQSISIKIEPSSLKPGDSGTISATISIPEGKQQTFDPNDQDYFFLSAASPMLSFGKTLYPKTYKPGATGEMKYSKSVTLTLPFKVKDSAKAGKHSFTATVGYNFCYETGACDPPEESEKQLSLEILALPTEAAIVTETEDPSADSLAPVELAEETEPETEAKPERQSPPMGETMKFLLFAFLGGIILNFTPCVLPILPIRIMSIINHAQKDRSKVLAHTLTYTLGVLISFAAMAAIFIALQAAGGSAGWGTQNQNPYFVIALMAVVFVFALSLLGVFEITAPGMNTASKATSKGGYSGSFFGGIFAFLMAISCTGPFLGAALPFAMKLPAVLILVFFMMIGLGFAFPFILIGLFPKALKIIPKPGDWMILFKELMGFVLLYLVYTMLKTTLQLTNADYFLKVIWFMMLLGFATWLYGTFVRMEKSRLTQWIFTIIPIVIIIWSVITYLPYKEEANKGDAIANSDEMLPAAHAPEGWYTFSPELLEKLLSEGKSVFLDIGAVWCKNCETNEKTVLFTKDIMADFAAREIVLLRGDFTKKDDVLLAWMKAHDRMGVPFNALYIPNSEPILFPELISKSMIRDAIAKVPNPGVTP